MGSWEIVFIFFVIIMFIRYTMSLDSPKVYVYSKPEDKEKYSFYLLKKIEMIKNNK
jgi:hypothetical protein